MEQDTFLFEGFQMSFYYSVIQHILSSNIPQWGYNAEKKNVKTQCHSQAITLPEDFFFVPRRACSLDRKFPKYWM